jgi:hypothetical protein
VDQYLENNIPKLYAIKHSLIFKYGPRWLRWAMWPMGLDFQLAFRKCSWVCVHCPCVHDLPLTVFTNWVIRPIVHFTTRPVEVKVKLNDTKIINPIWTSMWGIEISNMPPKQICVIYSRNKHMSWSVFLVYISFSNYQNFRHCHFTGVGGGSPMLAKNVINRIQNGRFAILDKF